MSSWKKSSMNYDNAENVLYAMKREEHLKTLQTGKNAKIEISLFDAVDSSLKELVEKMDPKYGYQSRFWDLHHRDKKSRVKRKGHRRRKDGRWIPAHGLYAFNVSRGKAKYLPYEVARAIVRKLPIYTVHDYYRWHAEERIGFIPRNPDKAHCYKAHWKGWGDFLGTNHKVRTKQKIYTKDFNSVVAEVHKFKFKSREEFCKAWDEGKLEKWIPKYPERAYADEWKGWRYFLGKSPVDRYNHQRRAVKVLIIAKVLHSEYENVFVVRMFNTGEIDAEKWVKDNIEDLEFIAGYKWNDKVTEVVEQLFTYNAVSHGNNLFTIHNIGYVVSELDYMLEYADIEVERKLRDITYDHLKYLGYNYV